MQRIPVDSTDIVSIGYDPKSQVLEIEFKQGRVYQYFDVEPHVHELFMRADSYGEYYFASINKHYRYKRVEGADKGSTKPAALAFASGNPRKFRDLQDACQKFGIQVEQLDLPVDEIQSHDPAEIALAKAKHAYKLAGERPVVVNDSFWNIVALRGFPGAFGRYIDDWLRPEELLRLLEDKKDRTIICTDTLVYYDGKRSKAFSQDTSGTIISEPRGQGKALQQIMVMAGQDRTVAELGGQHKTRDANADNQTIWQDFAKWYNLHRQAQKA